MSDGQRLILEYFDMICDSPSLLYSYALVFPPSSSWIHRYYSSELSHEVRVIRGLSGWGKCFRMVNVQERQLALGCWQNTFAVSRVGGEIAVFDTITGIQTLAVDSGHRITSLTFSTDGSLLVSGGEYGIAQLWDMQTGGLIKTFRTQSAMCVGSVSISADCITIAAGSGNAFCLWDVQTGQFHFVVQQDANVDQVCFLPLNPKHLISISGGRVWKWNIDGQQIAHTSEGSSVVFSLDGTKFALFNQDVIQICNSDSGANLAEFSLSNSLAMTSCFSPDGKLFAIAAGFTAYVWDITKSEPSIVETLICYEDKIASLGFSSPTSLISISTWESIKFWQVGTSSKASGTPGSSIQSITLKAKDGVAISSDSDGAVRIWDLSTGLCNASFQTPARGTYRRDIQLVDNRWILVWCGYGKLHVWAIEKGEFLKIVDMVEDEVEDEVDELRLSGDGSKVFYVSNMDIKARDIWTGKVVYKEYLGGPLAIRPYMAIDGSRVWMNVDGREIRGWNIGISNPDSIGPCDPFPNRPHLDFIGGIREYRMSLPPIENTITGKEFLRLPRSLDNPTDAQWDGQYLVAGYDTGDVLILKCKCTLSH